MQNKQTYTKRVWKDLDQLFGVLNNSIRYCVLRNYEPLPLEFDLEIHKDVDILVENLDKAVSIIGGTKIHKEPYRVAYMVHFENMDVPFDIRYLGDEYYDKRWEKDILKKAHLFKLENTNGFFIMDAENQYYSLLYHAYIQKTSLAEDYPMKLSVFANAAHTTYLNETVPSVKQLDQFMRRKGYRIGINSDRFVYYNWQNISVMKNYYFALLRYKIIRKIRKYIDKITTHNA